MKTEALRASYTTGLWASAAARAAALCLASSPGRIDSVTVSLPEGGEVTLPVFATRGAERWAEATVVRPAASDSLGALELIARVERVRWGTGLEIEGGEGIGRFAHEGLALSPGEAAINPGPRRMVRKALESLYPGEGLRILLSIPNGRALARRTLNSSFGVVGGLSILGTRGRVGTHGRAHRETILWAIRRAHRLGLKELYLVPGAPGGSDPSPGRICVGRHGLFASALARRMGMSAR